MGFNVYHTRCDVVLPIGAGSPDKVQSQGQVGFGFHHTRCDIVLQASMSCFTQQIHVFCASFTSVCRLNEGLINPGMGKYSCTLHILNLSNLGGCW